LSLSGCTKIENSIRLDTLKPQQFFENLTTEPITLSSTIKFGIVPHHEIAKSWISEFWATVALSRPETIILLSPNHPESGSSPIVTSNTSWLSAMGNLKSDTAIINRLKSETTLDVNIVKSEHGITTHIPYITYFIPTAKIVPLLVSSHISESELELFTSTLHKITIENKKILVIGSLDFSHYLDSNTATVKDTQTIELIQLSQIKNILRLGNDNVDSSEILAVIVRLAQLSRCHTPDIFHQGNSADFTDKKSNTTSYLIIGYQTDKCSIQ
jgi:hypothetical protein